MFKIDSIILNQVPKNLRLCFIIEKNWLEIVGPKLSKLSRPTKLSNKTLIISTNHPIISSEISLCSNIIFDRIKKNLGIEIDNLKFKTSNFELKEICKIEKDEEIKIEIEYPECLNNIENEKIKKNLLNIYKTIVKKNYLKVSKGDE
ncbi:DciA family protein [Thermodesulfobium sp. 4217-1]|uniref:DciA family protein n=1 Tax=Thermodesulfobium sp. 4217-1 TaxID=3120013 RepID=UPI00322143F9